MAERAIVEHISWDRDSILDVAVDASLEVLRVEGNVSGETSRIIGQNFGGFHLRPLETLVIKEPEKETALLAFIPPREYRLIGGSYDWEKPQAEAKLIVYNPLSVLDIPDFQIRQIHVALDSRLKELSGAFNLIYDDMELSFPRKHYAIAVERYSVPVLI